MYLPLITSFIAIIFTQLIKYPIALILNRKHARINLVTATGGMPSSHSAAVSSLITALALEYGTDSPYVAIATVFGVIIMFDSMGVRRQSGEQGVVLDMLYHHHESEMQHDKRKQSTNADTTHPMIEDYNLDNYEDLIITKYLGHKPTEVIVGVLTGYFVALICRAIYYGLF
ncbi:MAG: divergent PAP2 family protein [Aerococcaceae bacterium]|nr:divergent PAP2 family protein [Aerococcaceae bacterium]